MDRSMINAASSMKSIQQRIDIIANNLANLDIAGFKRRQASFEDILTGYMDQPQGFRQPGRLTPLGISEGSGARVSLPQLDMSQGELKETGNALDLGIEGNALFEVGVREVDEAGVPALQPQWTRGGSFQLALNPDDPDTVYIATADGHYVRGMNDEPLQVPVNHRIAIDGRGNVTAVSDTDPLAVPEYVGQIKLMQVIRPQLLQNTGDNLYTVAADSNVDDVLRQVDLNDEADAPAGVAVHQGFLEQSNVNLSVEMTDLLVMQRAYQLSSRAIGSSDAMMNLTNNMRG